MQCPITGSWQRSSEWRENPISIRANRYNPGQGPPPDYSEEVAGELRTNKIKCPKCGFKLSIPPEGEDVQCPKCGALLERTGNKWKFTEEPEGASLTESEAEEKWKRNHEK